MGSKLSLLLLSLAFALALPAQAQELSSSTLKNDQTQRPRRWSGDWNFTLGGLSSEEGKDEGAAAFVWLDTKFQYKFINWLHASINPRLSFYSSRVQERYDDEGSESRLWLFDGHLSLVPSPYFELRAGALNQGFHGTSMLVSGLRSFPGLQEIAQYKSSDIEAKLIIQQAIPTSHSLNTEREREEKLPMFNTEMIALSGKNFDWLDWEIKGGHFKWSNLPSKVAWESRRVGASGSGQEANGARFEYNHEGWFANSEVCYCSRSVFGFVIEFERIHNSKAPAMASDAQLWGLGPKLKLGDMVLDLRYRSYFIESDATVSSYNKSRLGNTNRIGEAFEVNLHFKEHNFSIFAEVYQARTINRSEYQKDLAIYYVGVETDYASF